MMSSGAQAEVLQPARTGLHIHGLLQGTGELRRGMKVHETHGGTATLLPRPSPKPPTSFQHHSSHICAPVKHRTVMLNL